MKMMRMVGMRLDKVEVLPLRSKESFLWTAHLQQSLLQEIPKHLKDPIQHPHPSPLSLQKVYFSPSSRFYQHSSFPIHSDVSSCLRNALLQALTTSLKSLPPSSFPIPASTFWTTHILPARLAQALGTHGLAGTFREFGSFHVQC